MFDASDPLTEPEIVAALEAGQVVVAYDPQELREDEQREAERLVRDRFAGDVTLTPFDGDMGAALTLNAWGVRRACGQFDIDAVSDFVDRFAGAVEGDEH